jgi:hypothetical protein
MVKGKGKMKNLNISKLGVVVMTGVTLSAYANTPSQIVRNEVDTAYNTPKHTAFELGNSWLSDSVVKPKSLEDFTQELTSSAQLKPEARIEKILTPNLSETKFASGFLGSVCSFFAPVVAFFSSLWNSIVLAA